MIYKVAQTRSATAVEIADVDVTPSDKRQSIKADKKESSKETVAGKDVDKAVDKAVDPAAQNCMAKTLFPYETVCEIFFLFLSIMDWSQIMCFVFDIRLWKDIISLF